MMKRPPYPTGNRIWFCFETKTIFLSERHLNSRPGRLLYNNFYSPYSIMYCHFMRNVTKHLKKFINKGFKVVFEYDGANVLLIYPKKKPIDKFTNNPKTANL